MPGSHPAGSRIFAAHFPEEEARMIEWLHEHNQGKIPVKITIAAVVRMLVNDSLPRHIPEDVAARIKEEVEQKRKERGRGKQARREQETGGGVGP